MGLVGELGHLLVVFLSFSTTVLKHRALHVRHTQLPLSREEEEARVINCETTFRNRFEDLRRCFDLVRFTFRSAFLVTFGNLEPTLLHLANKNTSGRKRQVKKRAPLPSGKMCSFCRARENLQTLMNVRKEDLPREHGHLLLGNKLTKGK